jgi:hypothetical protein
MYTKNEKRTHFCFSMAKIVTRTRHTLTLLLLLYYASICRASVPFKLWAKLFCAFLIFYLYITSDICFACFFSVGLPMRNMNVKGFVTNLASIPQIYSVRNFMNVVLFVVFFFQTLECWHTLQNIYQLSL